MTEGSILGHLTKYCIPAILGDLFQVTYNTVDSIIVGRYAGKQALAAVGVANPLMNIALFFIIGLGIGASVLMSEFYGAGDRDKLRREFATTLSVGVAASLAIGALLFALTGPILRGLHTPAEIQGDTAVYLRIVSLGMITTSLYNILAATSRSIGNTRTPLYCLVTGSLVNVGLDLLFVAGFGWGAAGAAAATVIAQGIAALLCGLLLRRATGELLFARRGFAPDRALLRRTLQFSYASALQQAGIYVGKLVVQGMVNPLGVNAIAAFNAVNRIDDYALIPERDIANGETVLVAQNHGAQKADRMRQGLRVGLMLEGLYGVIVSLVVFFGAEPLMRLFVAETETEVLRLGARYLRMMGLFYVLPGITNGMQGYMRALGKMQLTMIVTYAQMLTRAVATFLMIGALGLDAVPLACMAGWVMMTIWEGALLLDWGRKGKLGGA